MLESAIELLMQLGPLRRTPLHLLLFAWHAYNCVLVLVLSLVNITQRAYKIWTRMWPSQSDKLCWYCCHPFDNVPALLPRLMKSNVFEFTGNFCSWNCVKAYASNLGSRKPKGSEYIGLFAYLTVHRPQHCHVALQLPHPLDCQCLDRHHVLGYPGVPHDLQAFGGMLSITDFRRGFSHIRSLKHVRDIFTVVDEHSIIATISRPFMYCNAPTTTTTEKHVLPMSTSKKRPRKIKPYEEQEDDQAPVVHVQRPVVVQSLTSLLHSTRQCP